MTKKQEARLEGLMRDNLYRLLQLSKFTSYAAVLFELNLVKMIDVVKMIKCSFVLSLLHEKKSGQCYEVLMEEERKGKRGLMTEVREICEEFKLPDITKYNIGKEQLKLGMWKVARDNLWLAVLKDRRVPYQDTPKKFKKDYWKLERRRALLVFAFKIGNLDFRNNKKGEAMRKFGSVACLVPGCTGKDDLEHVLECSGYNSKPGDGAFEGDDVALAEYIDNLDSERFLAWRAPLLYRKSGSAPKLTSVVAKRSKQRLAMASKQRPEASESQE